MDVVTSGTMASSARDASVSMAAVSRTSQVYESHYVYKFTIQIHLQLNGDKVTRVVARRTTRDDARGLRGAGEVQDA